MDSNVHDKINQVTCALGNATQHPDKAIQVLSHMMPAGVSARTGQVASLSLAAEGAITSAAASSYIYPDDAPFLAVGPHMYCWILAPAQAHSNCQTFNLQIAHRAACFVIAVETQSANRTGWTQSISPPANAAAQQPGPDQQVTDLVSFPVMAAPAASWVSFMPR